MESAAMVARRQVHRKPVQAQSELEATPASQRRGHRRCSSNVGGGASARSHTAPLSHANTTRHVWLLSIMSLIFIAMLARDCDARAFLGSAGDMIGGVGGESSNFAQQQQVAVGDKFNAPQQQQQRQVDAALEYAVEMSCRNLIESLFYPRSGGRDTRSVYDYLDYASDLDRLKRASPKHTPRFGR